MKTFAAIVALTAILLISITTAFASEPGFDGRVSDEHPYTYLPEAQ